MDGSEKDTPIWEAYPLKSYLEIYPDFQIGTFSSDPHVLKQLGNPPACPTYAPDKEELAIMRSHFPKCDLAAPPWKKIQAKLVSVGLSLDLLKQLRSGDLVRVLAEQPLDSTEKTKAKKKLTVNDRMVAELASNPEAVKGWTAKQWAEHLKCGLTTVKDTETWKNLVSYRAESKARKQMNRNRR